MLNEIILAIVQAATEFLPISSSGHLALLSNIISEPNLFFFTILHLASLFAILVFTRKEIVKLLKFDNEAKKLWIALIIGTVPAAAFGFFFRDFISMQFSSLAFIGTAFISTGIILLGTKFTKPRTNLKYRPAFAIGLAQILALFPGISRSGITISAAKFLGLKDEEAFKFSFLLAIPLILGAVILEFGNAYFSTSILISFILCFFLSLLFLNILHTVLKRGYFWMFGFYCITIGIISLALFFL